MNIRHLKKILIGILCLGFALLFLLKPVKQLPSQPLLDTQIGTQLGTQPNTQPESQPAIQSPAIITNEAEPIILTAPIELASTQQALLEQSANERMAKLIKQRLTPEMRAEINARLNPPNQNYTEIKTEQGGYVNLGKRAASVAVAFIDDEGNTVVTDITEPLADN